MKRKLSMFIFPAAVLMILIAAVLFLIFFYQGNDGSSQAVISEIIPLNTSLYADEYGGYYDIVELYNPGENKIDLTGWGLSDDIDRPHRWVFPKIAIQPNEYLIVYLSGGNFTDGEGLYADFSLDKDGEEVVLTDSGFNIVQIVPYSKMSENMSYALIDEIYQYVEEGTPGRENAGEIINQTELYESIPDIIPSLQSGVYTEPVYLKLESASDYDIRYTLDGTDPTQDSKKYNVQLYLDYSDKNQLRYANIQSTFYEQAEIPTEDVAKATVVKAQYFDGSTPVGKMFAGTYFIWDEGTDKYTFDLISITTDPENLFDEYTGIYVVGDFYRRNAPENVIGATDANYHQRGNDWERDAHIEFFDDGNSVLAQHIGIRIFGDWSRSYTKKSFKLFPRTKYDDTGKFTYPFFDGLCDANGDSIAEFENLILRSGGQDWDRGVFTDPLVDYMSEGIADYQAYKPYILFLNGEYWGIYHLREHMDENYVASHFNVDKDKISIMLHSDGPEIYCGNEHDYAHYLSMLDYAENTDLSKNENFVKISEMIDLDNFINYYCIQLFIRNGDWPGNNVKVWRYKGNPQPNNEYTDGRYRFLLYDTEFSFGLYDQPNSYMTNSFEYASDLENRYWPNPWWSNILFANMMKNLSFRERFLTTYADYLNSRFSYDEFYVKLNEFKDMYTPQMQEYIDRYRFFNMQSVDDWEQTEINRLAVFANRRSDYVFITAKNYYDIKDYYSLEIVPIENGSINVNGNYSLPLPNHSTPQTLTYFSDYQLEFEAIADDGYTLKGFIITDIQTNETLLKSNDNSSDDGRYTVHNNTLYISPDSNVMVEVVFVEE